MGAELAVVETRGGSFTCITGRQPTRSSNNNDSRGENHSVQELKPVECAEVAWRQVEEVGDNHRDPLFRVSEPLVI